ncbi:MAG: magnesium/cobalt transporter CorA [Acidobacteria bacterium]|nr:magnesium/cobalt transporter CorA [Acidobacteriota bacterium]
MITIFVHANGQTRRVDTLDPALLQGHSRTTIWVDLAGATGEESRILSDLFHFHELAVEDALSAIHHPKVETYDGYLYVILHGIDLEESAHRFATHDVDFFLGSNYLVTVHDGDSRSVARMRDICVRNNHILAEGPSALMHHIVDTIVDNYQPEVEKLEEKLDELEKEVFEAPPRRAVIKSILALKKDVASLRRVTLPQRDVVSRLARPEFPQVKEAVTYRFRDVYDHFVRLADLSMAFQDRITGLLEAHLSNVSNQLNEVMKVLTVISTIFMPMTVVTGLYGMNVHLVEFPGGDLAQFWWVVAVMLTVSGLMLLYFRRHRWL